MASGMDGAEFGASMQKHGGKILTTSLSEQQERELTGDLGAQTA